MLDIWIFDEPVAAMDPSSEYSFFNTVLEEDDKSKTMIFVSHRLKIASKMNRIIYLENGKIVGDRDTSTAYDRLREISSILCIVASDGE